MVPTTSVREAPTTSPTRRLQQQQDKDGEGGPQTRTSIRGIILFASTSTGSIAGVGVDQDPISAIPSHNPTFVERNSTEAEVAYCQTRPSPYHLQPDGQKGGRILIPRCCFKGCWRCDAYSGRRWCSTGDEMPTLLLTARILKLSTFPLAIPRPPHDIHSSFDFVALLLPAVCRISLPPMLCIGVGCGA